MAAHPPHDGTSYTETMETPNTEQSEDDGRAVGCAAASYAPEREWQVDGRLVYTVEHYGWRKGEEQTQNAATIAVDVRGATLEMQEALAREIAAFLNARTVTGA